MTQSSKLIPGVRITANTAGLLQNGDWVQTPFAIGQITLKDGIIWVGADSFPDIWIASLTFLGRPETPSEEVTPDAWRIIERVAKLTVAGGDPLQDPAFAKYPAIADLVAKAQAALRARQEVPANPHEQSLTANNVELIEQALSHPPLEAPAKGAGERGVAGAIMDGLWPILGGNHTDAEVWNEISKVVSSALCAHSSAPEAREEALGNLLAVIHGDGGHRALEVGTKQAALEAEKIVAGLLAAPSADKLRIAATEVRLIESISRAVEQDFETLEAAWPQSRRGSRAQKAYDQIKGRWEGVNACARDALIALEAEGAK